MAILTSQIESIKRRPRQKARENGTEKMEVSQG